MVVLALTQSGRRRAREVTNSGADSTFLASLIENGPSSLEEISTDLHIPQRQVSTIAGRLSRQGLIKREE